MQPVVFKAGARSADDVTNLSGDFKFSAKFNKTTSVSVVFPGTSACRKDEASGTIRVS
jgi:hypothetical protein